MAHQDDQQRKTIKSFHSSSSTLSKPLPSEIIFEILSRLPVESLLRCKSVCKSWRSLISDPHFIKYHLTLSTTDNQYARHHLLVCNYVTVQNLKSCPLYDAMYDHNLINPLELDYPMKSSFKKVSIAGSCNGLVCITIDRHYLFIWNPSTRKSVLLPDHLRSVGLLSHSFGCNKSSDDYKVVVITCSYGDMRDNIVMIYSSKNGNWKQIGSFPHWIWMNYSGVFLNGALHWIARKDCDSWIIVSLDLAKDTYGEVLLPVDEKVGIDLGLGILGDCLCVLYDYSQNSKLCVDVWVMKVYGVKDSWFKLVSISCRSSVSRQSWGDLFSTPLCVSDDGRYVLRLGSSIVVFDSKDDSALLEIPQFNRCLKACIFVESLVSPAGHENLV